MASKLQIWKAALVHLEKETIADTTDVEVTAVNVFNNAWDTVVEEAFNEGDWNIFKKTVALVVNGSETAALGWTFVWDYPDDYMRTVAVSNIPSFNHEQPFIDYVDQGGFLHSNTNPLYLRYISSDQVDDLTKWPTMFCSYVALKLAERTCGRLTGGTGLGDRLMKKCEKALRQAKSVDARNENNKRLPTGSWLRARVGGYGTGNDGLGNTIVGGEITFDEGDV